MYLRFGVGAAAPSGAQFVGTPTYKLKLLMNGGNNSDVVVDTGASAYTITYATNDGAQHAQSSAQVLFGASSFFSNRRGSPVGSGGGDGRLTWTPLTGMDWGASPDLVIGGAIMPTHQSLDDHQGILQNATGANDNWILWYDDSGKLHYLSKTGGSTTCSLVTTGAFTFNEWNWFFLSAHGGVAQLWLGTDDDGIVNMDVEGADTSAYAFGTGGTQGRISADGGGGFNMNCYLDHIYAATGVYIDDTDFDYMEVPTSEP